jgi:hypothetical protein
VNDTMPSTGWVVHTYIHTYHISTHCGWCLATHEKMGMHVVD